MRWEQATAERGAPLSKLSMSLDSTPRGTDGVTWRLELVNEGAVTDFEVLCAALLHDTVEDTATTHEELVDAFGSRIARIVAEVTDDKHLPKEERKRLQIEHAPSLSREAKLVKLADKLVNLRDVAERPPAKWDLARRREYFDWAKRVVDGMRGTHPRLEAAFDAAYARKP